ncbi:hypothetical protein EV385_4251 [Krasilnikovia cinnamomea]|uniref:Uncharacterized protein n=1 Tax=Krasilnikovia cinnamomea TaxID=349313 RepID=A0A4Q7ZPE4_9ACTN|nr:hypothetical protein [Krasilnikovia cinnamomea]RZU52393.1 hypothetical protein EV385_4251 [Krasilnikovia cinnamomea]
MFYGREKLEDLVTGLVRVDRDQAVPMSAGPVVALEGSGGSGRSAALRFLADQHAAALPVAIVDAVADAGRTATFDEVSILLLSAASELAQPPAGFGRIPFHRLFLGHLALAQPIDPDATPEQRHAAMATALKSYRKRRAGAELIGQVLSEVAVGALDHAGGNAVPGLGSALRPLTAALTRTRLTRGSALKDAEQWYADQLTDGRKTPAAALARLHRWWQSEAARGQVEEVLVRAFLADLRAAAARRRSGWRRWRAELLLDNADSPAGQRLLALLFDARAAAPTPLVVVAASGGESLPAPVACAAEHSRALSEVEAAGLARDELHALRWLRITLPPLTRAETIAAVADREIFDQVGVHRVARVTHRLADGHPLAGVLILDALGRQTDLLQNVDKLLDGEPVDPDAHRARSLADEILLEMTERTHATIRPSGSFRDTLVTLAAARDLEDADRLTQTEHLRSARQQDLRLALSDTLWSRTAPGGARRLAAPARFLALRELAARPGGHPHSWAAVFRTLLTLADDGLATAEPERLLGARTASLHYQLALGEVRSVAVTLAHLLPGLSAPAWLGVLDDIVATPDPLDPLSGAADELAGFLDPLQLAIGRLLIGLRRLGDPRLTDPEVVADLRLLVADQYRDVARAATHQSREYRNRAARYELPDDEH